MLAAATTASGTGAVGAATGHHGCHSSRLFAVSKFFCGEMEEGEGIGGAAAVFEPGGAAHRRRQGRRPRGRQTAAGSCAVLRVWGKEMRGSRVFQGAPVIYTAPIQAGGFLAVDLVIDGGNAPAAAQADFSPGGNGRWAASPAQPLAAGPRARAGTLTRPWAGFSKLGSSVSCEQCAFPLKFSISEAKLSFCFICCFNLS
jgi:hypothetical protein